MHIVLHNIPAARQVHLRLGRVLYRIAYDVDDVPDQLLYAQRDGRLLAGPKTRVWDGA